MQACMTMQGTVHNTRCDCTYTFECVIIHYRQRYATASSTWWSWWSMVQIPARLNAGGQVIITRGVESVSLITDEDAGRGG